MYGEETQSLDEVVFNGVAFKVSLYNFCLHQQF